MADTQQTTGSIISRVKKMTKGGWTNAKTVAPREGGMNLPSGIRGGVARLTGYKIAETEDKDRTPYVSFRGVVMAPKDYEGERFYKTVYINDRPEYKKTMQDALNEISACFQNLGVDTSEMVEDQWEATLKELCAVKRAFSFHTWAPPDSDRVSTFIDAPQKKLDDYPDMDPNQPIDGLVEEPEVAAPTPQSAPVAKPKAATPKQNPAPARSTREAGSPPKGPKAKATAAPAPEPESGGSFLDEVIAGDNADQTVDFGGADPEPAQPAFSAPDVGSVYDFWVGQNNPDGTEKLHEVEIVEVSKDGKTFTGRSTLTGKELPGLLVERLR